MIAAQVWELYSCLPNLKNLSQFHKGTDTVPTHSLCDAHRGRCWQLKLPERTSSNRTDTSVSVPGASWQMISPSYLKTSENWKRCYKSDSWITRPKLATLQTPHLEFINCDCDCTAIHLGDSFTSRMCECALGLRPSLQELSRRCVCVCVCAPAGVADTKRLFSCLFSRGLIFFLAWTSWRVEQPCEKKEEFLCFFWKEF